MVIKKKKIFEIYKQCLKVVKKLKYFFGDFYKYIYFLLKNLFFVIRNDCRDINLYIFWIDMVLICFILNVILNQVYFLSSFLCFYLNNFGLMKIVFEDKILF